MGWAAAVVDSARLDPVRSCDRRDGSGLVRCPPRAHERRPAGLAARQRYRRQPAHRHPHRPAVADRAGPHRASSGALSWGLVLLESAGGYGWSALADDDRWDVPPGDGRLDAEAQPNNRLPTWVNADRHP